MFKRITLEGDRFDAKIRTWNSYAKLEAAIIIQMPNINTKLTRALLFKDKRKRKMSKVTRLPTCLS